MSTQSQANASPGDSEIAELSKGPQLSEREREFVDAIMRFAFGGRIT